MSGESSSYWDKDLNEIVFEYLDFCNFKSTKEILLNELTEKGIPLPVSRQTISINESNEIQNNLFQAFNNGDRNAYFELWNSNLSTKLRDEDSVCQKLEFYCQVYFAIYPLKHDVQNPDIESQAMQGFREYLETQGRRISTNQEFIQYYALPYVSNPREHPSFSELFQSTWIPGLEMRLKRFFQLVFAPRTEPLLVNLYKHKSSGPDERNLKAIQAKIEETEHRASQYFKKLNQVQLNFHGLLGITAELIDLLEGSLQGVPINATHLKYICQKIFVSQNPKSKSNGIPLDDDIDLSRPGTASKLLLQSIQLTNGSFDDNQKLMFDPIIVPPSQPQQHRRAARSKPLNVSKIKFDIEHGHVRAKVLLLQAFRWRLTKTDVETRDKFIATMTQHDLLGIAPGDYHDSVFRMMNSQHGSLQLQEYMARLINAVATLCKGRSYLVKTSSVCELLFLNIINITYKESIFRESLIGALQKLSLRRHIQTYMISNGMIEWLLKLLEENSSLSEYTLDYSVALLMNLCLRSSGKKRCIDHKSQVIRVLSKMLDSFNKEIASYVNGALYSILVMPEIREEANKMNLEATLRNHMKLENADMNRQFEYIINQLKSTDEPKMEESDDEEEDDDEEDPEVLETELDKDETVVALGDELCGEELLNTKYGVSESSSSPSTLQNSGLDHLGPPGNRPVTPGTFLAKRASLSAIEPITDRPETRSGSAATVSKQPQTGASNQPDPIRENPNYQKAFSSKPKIPRTPDEENLKRNNLQNSLSGPIQSAGRLPTPSVANGGRKGKESRSTK